MDSTDDESQQDTVEATKATTPARVTAAERRRRKEAEAARLRAEGLDYDAIADRLGYRDRSGAHKAARRAGRCSAALDR